LHEEKNVSTLELQAMGPVEKIEASGITERRRQILDAARQLFLEHGYGDTSMDRIAEKAEVARRTVYNQFKSKEALFEAMVQEIWSHFPVLDITSDEESLADPRAGLLRVGHAVANFWITDESVAFLRMVIAEGGRFPSLLKTFLELGKGPAMAAVTHYLLKLTKKKLLDISDTKLATRQFLGMIDEPLLWVRVVGLNEKYTAKQRSVIVENAVDMFLGFYRPR